VMTAIVSGKLAFPEACEVDRKAPVRTHITIAEKGPAEGGDGGAAAQHKEYARDAAGRGRAAPAAAPAPAAGGVSWRDYLDPSDPARTAPTGTEGDHGPAFQRYTRHALQHGRPVDTPGGGTAYIKGEDPYTGMGYASGGADMKEFAGWQFRHPQTWDSASIAAAVRSRGREVIPVDPPPLHSEMEYIMYNAQMAEAARDQQIIADLAVVRMQLQEQDAGLTSHSRMLSKTPQGQQATAVRNAELLNAAHGSPVLATAYQMAEDKIYANAAGVNLAASSVSNAARIAAHKTAEMEESLWRQQVAQHYHTNFTPGMPQPSGTAAPAYRSTARMQRQSAVSRQEQHRAHLMQGPRLHTYSGY